MTTTYLTAICCYQTSEVRLELKLNSSKARLKKLKYKVDVSKKMNFPLTSIWNRSFSE